VITWTIKPWQIRGGTWGRLHVAMDYREVPKNDIIYVYLRIYICIYIHIKIYIYT